MHPVAGEPVTLTVSAQDPRGVEAIEIWEERNALRTCADGSPCATVESKQQVATCRFEKPASTGECVTTVREGYPDGYLIGYSAIATNRRGARSGEQWTYFASGRFPWPDQPVPVYVTAPPAKAIDLVIIPDAAYKEEIGAFRAEVTTLIKDTYLSGMPGAEELRRGRGYWNFYVTYTPATGAAKTGCPAPPANWLQLRGVANVGIILRKGGGSECIELGEGALFALGPSSGPLAIHALSHAVFNLADEYCCDGAYWEADKEPNIFSTKTGCRTHASAHEWPITACVEISPPSWWRTVGQSGWYRSDTAGDIMADPMALDARHGRADRARINAVYARCREGRC